MSKDYGIEMTVATDLNGGEVIFNCREIPYSVFKSARGLLVDDPDKAVSVIMLNITDDESKERFKKLQETEAENLVFWQSLETGVVELMTPIEAKVKKK